MYSFNLESLMAVPTSGVAIYLDESSKSFYVFFSKDIPQSVSKDIRLLKQGIHPSRELQDTVTRDSSEVRLEILTHIQDEHEMKCAYVYWIGEYVKLGYRNMRPNYIPVKYKIRYEIEADGYTRPLVYVKLVSNRGDKLVVGIFDFLKDARSWVASTYSPIPFVYPIYCSNGLTEAYNSRLRESGKL